MSKTPEAGTMDYQERAIRSAIVGSYLDQRALYTPDTPEASHDVDPVLMFGVTRQNLRSIYTERAGKLALSRALEQRTHIHPNGRHEVVFVRASGATIDGRLQAVLSPGNHSIAEAIQRVAPKPQASISPVMTTLKQMWARLAALENEHARSGTGLTLVNYLCEIYEPQLLPPKIIKPPVPKLRRDKSEPQSEQTTSPVSGDVPTQPVAAERELTANETLIAPEVATGLQTPEATDLDVLTTLSKTAPEAAAVITTFLASKSVPGAIFNNAAERLDIAPRDMIARFNHALVVARDGLSATEYHRLAHVIRRHLPTIKRKR